MSEVIQKIEEVDNVKFGDCNSGEGYKITTNKQEILLLIEQESNCCEDFGYFASEDDFSEFIGSGLIKLETVDEAYNKKVFDNQFEFGIDEGAVYFVNFETSKGTLQLAVYNAHNGYYGHSIYLKSDQLTEEGGL